MEKTLSPLLVYAYNRPDHLKRCIQSLQSNALAKDTILYIFSDAPKDKGSEEKVRQVREYIHTITGFKHIYVTEREENWGLARSIIDGVTKTLENYDRVIIVEDDLILAPYFLQFMNDALETYKNEERVGHIQACDFTKDPSLPDTFLIKFTGSWGWGTWARAWKYFNPNGQQLLDELKSKKLTRHFDFNNNYGFTRMLRRQIEGKNNSWAIRWNATLFLKDMLSLNAGRSLVQNEGFDGSGTNCGCGELYKSDLWLKPLPVIPICPVEENAEARRAFERYYHRTNSFYAKVIRRIKRMIKGDFKA